jgi:hypothetical protein
MYKDAILKYDPLHKTLGFMQEFIRYNSENVIMENNLFSIEDIAAHKSKNLLILETLENPKPGKSINAVLQIFGRRFRIIHRQNIDELEGNYKEGKSTWNRIDSLSGILKDGNFYLT